MVEFLGADIDDLRAFAADLSVATDKILHASIVAK